MRLARLERMRESAELDMRFDGAGGWKIGKDVLSVR